MLTHWSRLVFGASAGGCPIVFSTGALQVCSSDHEDCGEMLILQSTTVRLSNVKSLSITARKHHSQSEDRKGCRAHSHRAHASGGVALSKTREELEARVQKRTAELTRANEALR
jgi:C4-dicarboxylate-specific signal transduction histidine kinase